MSDCASISCVDRCDRDGIGYHSVRVWNLMRGKRGPII